MDLGFLPSPAFNLPWPIPHPLVFSFSSTFCIWTNRAIPLCSCLIHFHWIALLTLNLPISTYNSHPTWSFYCYILGSSARLGSDGISIQTVDSHFDFPTSLYPFWEMAIHANWDLLRSVRGRIAGSRSWIVSFHSRCSHCHLVLCAIPSFPPSLSSRYNQRSCAKFTQFEASHESQLSDKVR